jgi:lipid-A-disaccharide synthase
VDHVLAALPFEADWYAQRGVDVEYVGHPFFDEVAEHVLDHEFCIQLRSDPSQLQPASPPTASGARLRISRASISTPPDESCRRPLVALLPGSRNMEVRRNFPVMLRVVQILHARHPDVRFPVACYKESQRDFCRSLLTGQFADLPIDLYVGRTPELIASAHCCLMVSGSVSLELLARGAPAVVLYRGSWLFYVLVKLLVTCKYMSLPNLIAGRELMPEFPFVGRVSLHIDRMAVILDRWLADDRSLAKVRRDMLRLRDDVVQTGGVGRAADAILSRLVPARLARHAA